MKMMELQNGLKIIFYSICIIASVTFFSDVKNKITSKSDKVKGDETKL